MNTFTNATGWLFLHFSMKVNGAKDRRAVLLSTHNAITNAVAQSAMSVAQNKMPNMMHNATPWSMAWCKMLRHKVQCHSMKNKATAQGTMCNAVEQKTMPRLVRAMQWLEEQCHGIPLHGKKWHNTMHNAATKAVAWCTEKWEEWWPTQYDNGNVNQWQYQWWHQATATQFDPPKKFN